MSEGSIIVIGASAGGVETYIKLVAGLPEDLPASVFTVLHLASGGVSALPKILSRSGSLPAIHPRDGEKIEPGRIYVAPPSHHMLLKPGLIQLLHGPKENGALPAIDPLFRSAARAYGKRVIGVILSGLLDDGVAGLETIHRHGGITVAQDPDEALYPSMPLNAINRVRVDHILPVAQIASLLSNLARTRARENGSRGIVGMKGDPDILELYTENGVNSTVGVKPSAFTCPECGGTLDQDESGRYRCHVGHAFSLAHLEAAQLDVLKEVLWKVIRLFKERAEVLSKLAASMKAQNSTVSATRFEAQAREAMENARFIRKILLGSHEERPRVLSVRC